ncbi:MAG: hypothetical protein ACUVV0_07605 [Anaerolineae bacterium]
MKHIPLKVIKTRRDKGDFDWKLSEVGEMKELFSSLCWGVYLLSLIALACYLATPGPPDGIKGQSCLYRSCAFLLWAGIGFVLTLFVAAIIWGSKEGMCSGARCTERDIPHPDRRLSVIYLVLDDEKVAVIARIARRRENTYRRLG